MIARSHVEPYVTPYYDTYAAPYLDQARPYVEVIHTRVYMPASNIAKSGYEKYGAPAWEQAQAYGVEQWRTQLMPRVQAAQDRANQFYKSEVDPYVQQGVAVVTPYYQKANAAAIAVYWDHFVPFYTHSMPFIGKTYSTGQDILVTHVMPGARYTWSSLVYFANSSLWPQLTGFYSEQVEPQLVKIGERLASYREGKRLRTVIEDMESSFAEQPVSSTVSAPEQTVDTFSSTTTTSTAEVPSAQPTLSPAEIAQQERERIDSDLQSWEAKFATATDKGIEDLEARIETIVAALIANSAKSHGESLSTALQTVSDEKVSNIKQHINELAQSLPDEDAPEAEESHREELVRDIRNSALSVRDRAQTLREWSHAFEDELVRRVSAAVNSTLHVLDNIRDLGLQEIGTRWAWMDGVTYADWARYHEVKAELEDWRDEIRKVGMNHKSVVEAKALAQEILDRGMEIAEGAAKELVRLKDVGYWKIAAREVSDNFDTRTEPPPPRPKPVDESESEDDHAGTSEDSHEANTSQDDGAEREATPEENDAEDAHESFDSDRTSTAVESDAPEGQNDDVKQTHAKPAWGVAAAEVGSQQIVLDDEEQDPVDARAAQFEAVQGIVSELLVGKQASFTESMMSKLHAIYETPYPISAVSSASSYVSGVYDSASSAASTSASSMDDVVQQASENVQTAAETASAEVFGSSKEPVEQVTEAAADASSTASASASSAMHEDEGDPHYMHMAREMIQNIKSKYNAALANEPGAVENLAVAVKSAHAQLAEMAGSTSSSASEAMDTTGSRVEDATSSIKSAAAPVKDEL